MINNKLLVSLIAMSSLGLSIPSYSLDYCSGLYVGLQGGYSRADYDLEKFLNKDFSKSEFAGRGYIGFQIDQFWGLETGFTMLAGTEFPRDMGDVKTTHWDLLAKLGTPFGNSGFRGDLKAGGAHVMSKFDANDAAKSLGLDDVKEWKIRPVAGASLTYLINRNVHIDASYYHVFSHPSESTFKAPTVDFAMVGVKFLFNSI
jgi:hypothetical protein